MKNTYVVLALALLFVTSCKKKSNSLGDDYGCINRVVYTPADYTISTTDYNAITPILQQKNVPVGSLRFNQAIHSKTGNDSISIYNAVLYADNLPVFNYLISYHFTNGNYDYSSSATYGLANTVDTTHFLKLSQVRKIYIDRVNNATYKDSCLRAEYGLYHTGNTTSLEPLVKAWKVTPPNADYPVAYIKDDGTLLGWDTGIQTL